MNEWNLLVGLLKESCVFLVVVYLLSRFKFFKGVTEGKFNVINQIILIIVFGALAVYGTYNGVRTTGAIANIRDMGPMIAGLLGGPWAGLGAGLIGGIHRYFIGGFTDVACGLGTVISGIAAGLMYIKFKDKLGIWKPTLFAFVMMALDMVLILIIARPFSDAVELVKIISMPMIVAPTVGIAVFSIMMSGIRREKKEL
jgi:sigma-B regulation protein RsbU (phosphoserine phosphatase)